MLLSGNLPMQTEVASVRILTYIENGNLARRPPWSRRSCWSSPSLVIVALDVIQRRVARRG